MWWFFYSPLVQQGEDLQVVRKSLQLHNPRGLTTLGYVEGNLRGSTALQLYSLTALQQRVVSVEDP